MPLSFVRFFSTLTLVLACLVYALPVARADIIAVTTSRPTAQVAVPNGSSVTVVWRVRRLNNFNFPRPVTQTIVSTNGTIAIGGTAVATISTTLSRVNTTQVSTTTTEIITETLFVPRNVAFQMAKNPGSTATYSRTFADGSGVTATGAILLVPSGPSGAVFGIRRLDLFFEDRSRVKVLPSGNDLVALAELNFNGAGVAQLEWQIAEPSATRGSLVFRRLQVVRRSLAGRGRATIKSPPLPTQTQGLYLVRLVAINPSLDFETPALRYFIVPRQAATSAPAGQRIGLLGPAEGALLSTETEFSWNKTPGAAVYQLEVYPLRPGNPVGQGEVQSIGGELLVDPDELATRPITGIALPADQNSISLQSFSLAHLDVDRAYLWRVIAIAGNGAVIGTSSLRRITTPR